MTINFKEEALSSLEGLLRTGNLDAIIRYDLVEAYKYSLDTGGEEDWALRDALKKVIKYYSSDAEYEQFKREVGLEG